jgi:hypothetical protein
MVLYSGGTPSPTPSPTVGASANEQAGIDAWMQALGGAGIGTGQGSVFMEKVTPGDIKQYRMEGLTPPSQYMTLDEAYNKYNDFSGKQLRDFIAQGQLAGQLADGAGFIEGQGLWKQLVDASAGLTAAGHNISPFDVLAGYLGKGPLATGQPGSKLWQVQYRGGRKFLVNTQTGQVQYQGPQFETTYSENIDLTDPTTAKAIATSVFQQLLHRDPNAGEMGGFASALSSAEQASPVTNNITTEYDPNTGEPIGQSTTSSGGMTAEGRQYLAAQRIKKSKEYGATQAATTYANALENAIFNNPYGAL